METQEKSNLEKWSQTQWDCCVIGDGVLPLWVAHWLWSNKRSVLWISSESSHGPERAFLKHAWLWAATAGETALLSPHFRGLDLPLSQEPIQLVYYDARSSKRFKPFHDMKIQWEPHEKDFLSALQNEAIAAFDLWDWHQRLHSFYSSEKTIEFFHDPLFVKIQGFPLLELKLNENSKGQNQLSQCVIGGLNKNKAFHQSFKANKFYLGDYPESLAGLIANEAESFSQAVKGRAYRAGFGVKFSHHPKSVEPKNQTMIVPLTVHGSTSHMIGRFHESEDRLDSHWCGFLTDEELEDNHEILKKIKQAKRAIERAIPGFVDSIQKESVTFEPKMFAMDLVKKRKNQWLNAELFTDHFGLSTAIERFKQIVQSSSMGKAEVQVAENEVSI